MTHVPPQYQPYIDKAAAETGLAAAIVAAQINEESGFNPNAVSSAGAEGIAQFLPSTFRSYSNGSPFNVNDAFSAYAAFMSSLLHEFNGDVRKALAAYNAGPGNLPAGYGYADTILAAAGAGVDTTASTATAAAGGGSVLGGDVINTTSALDAISQFVSPRSNIGSAVVETQIGGKLSEAVAGAVGVAKGVTNWLDGFVTDADNLLKSVLWLVNPANEIRLLMGLFGIGFFGIGAFLLFREVKHSG